MSDDQPTSAAPVRLCSVDGCEKVHYGRGLCQACYTRLRRRGTTDKLVRVPRSLKPCEVEGCDKIADQKSARGLCAGHYSRLIRKGSINPETPLRQVGAGYVGADGYRQIFRPMHPLAGSNGYVREHRAIAYAKLGGGPQRCHWCEAPVTWAELHVDHVDGVRLNNRPSNLVAACQACNKERGAAGNPSEFRPRRLT